MGELTAFEQGALAAAAELVPADHPLRSMRIANVVTTAVVHHETQQASITPIGITPQEVTHG